MSLARDSIPPGSNPEPVRVQPNSYSSTTAGFGAFLVFLVVLVFFLVVLAFFLVLVFWAPVASGVAGVSTGAVTEGAATGGVAGVAGRWPGSYPGPGKRPRGSTGKPQH